MKLSVIIPAFNGSVPHSVSECCSGRGDVELIVVEGVSPVSDARNIGMSRATGEYIAWVDNDDEVSAEWLDEIFRAIMKGPDIVDFDALVRWVDIDRSNYTMINQYDNGWVDSNRYVRDYLCGKIGGQLWCKVFRRSLFDGLQFRGAQYEELEVMAELLPRVKKVYHIPKTLYIYQRKANGLSQCTNGYDDIIRIIRFSYSRKYLQVGVALIVADYIRHSSDVPCEAVVFLRKQLFKILFTIKISLRIKAKCILAAVM